MQCHSCGSEVRDGQKFCMECGASLRGVADITGEVPVVPGRKPQAAADEPTRPMEAIVAPPAAPPPPPPSRSSAPPPPPPVPVSAEASTAQGRSNTDDTVPMAATVRTPAMAAAPVLARSGDVDRTSELTLVEATEPPIEVTGELPPTYQPVWTPEEAATAPGPRRSRQGFRLRPLLILALLGAAATVLAVTTALIEIVPSPDGRSPRFMVNDFGTDNTVAALLAAGAMVLGAVIWCFGYRWGAGLAGGAGAGLAGWAALVLGLVEWPISTAEAAGSSAVTQEIGYWALLAAGGLGVLVLLVSLLRAGRDRRAGLDPWIAALGAVSFLIAAGGPLIPEGSADWSGNWSSDTLGVELPTLFFVGRAVQLGLLALCGVVGFLLVRRYGLGLAVGSAVAAGWMLVAAATDRTAYPVGPAYENPGSLDLQPHAVTIVGFAMVGFFSLVAIVMALLDADR